MLGKACFGSNQPAHSFSGAKVAFFFERAIFEESWSSAAPAQRFLEVSRFFGARPPVHFGDLELTGTKKNASLMIFDFLKMGGRADENQKKKGFPNFFYMTGKYAM